jgi:hypothetical protein
MKSSFCVLVLALSACATATSPRQHEHAGMSESPGTPGTVTITGDDLRQSGRTELPDALRASSPLFH